MNQKQLSKKIRKALRKIYGRDEPIQDMVADALTDLRHLCDVAKVNFTECDRCAQDHYLVEKNLS
jgi:hypothetical protein